MAKSKTQFMKFRGQTAYPKLYEPDEFRGSRKWKVPLYVDAETKQKIKDAGIQLRFKDDSGEKSGVAGEFCVFSRNTVANFGNGVEDLNPPVIRDAYGNALVEYSDSGEMIGDRVVIGNGSVVELDVEVYETKNFGNGQRIREVKIIDLIEYDPEGSTEDVTEENSEEAQEAPKEQTQKKSSDKPKRKW